MRKKTISTYRKIYKNSKRNTFKKKKNKRNNSKKKTKRTRGGYWGRCHNQWKKLIDEKGVKWIYDVGYEKLTTIYWNYE